MTFRKIHSHEMARLYMYVAVCHLQTFSVCKTVVPLCRVLSLLALQFYLICRDRQGQQLFLMRVGRVPFVLYATF